MFSDVVCLLIIDPVDTGVVKAPPSRGGSLAVPAGVRRRVPRIPLVLGGGAVERRVWRGRVEHATRMTAELTSHRPILVDRNPVGVLHASTSVALREASELRGLGPSNALHRSRRQLLRGYWLELLLKRWLLLLRGVLHWWKRLWHLLVLLVRGIRISLVVASVL